LFEKHRSAAWFLEKYDPTEVYSDLRSRVRKQGWQGALDQFIDDLEAGKFDFVSETIKNKANDETKDQNDGAQASTDPTTTESTETKPDAPKVEEDVDKIVDENEGGSQGDKEGDNDEVIIPHKGHQVMIKTIPPDIGRLKLEPVSCISWATQHRLIP
jgi:hypothetical protein